ncbi:uncharacterized protein EAF01_001756 [Botrytis porri]|uniref:Uncharacterized protein n=1 Tax=Botrytis porri TaxID=87229 RepID=A0A4Z1KE45_9HELO|nr:uncharacterized protein EAF01_001756 [Botrytis porri]KAF7912735.1 hypothetical protein EAF01_001756 [Botrytis porri]TGO83688.1 hypothetical protein BPOR_0607g00040 [Botrytis porri]
MALSAGARSAAADAKKPKTLADMLLSSEDSPSTNKSAERWPPDLGLPNADAISDFLQSHDFCLHFDLLYKSAIHPRTLTAPNPKVSSIVTVQKMIIEGRAYGDGKYSDPDPHMKGWQDADHYVLCLYRLYIFNSTRRNGLSTNR